MKRQKSSVRGLTGLVGAGILALAVGGCATTPAKSSGDSLTPAKPGATSSAAPIAPVASKLPTIRIKAGIDEPLTDSKGAVWAVDTGFEGGSEIDRPDLQVTGTPTPEIYRSEHYSMDSWSAKVPNGSYLVKLHFSEGYDGIASPTDRLFTYAVKDGTASGKTIKEVRDFSPWKASGAQFKAYVDTIPVKVTTGQITITFTPQEENPQINAIEVVPN